MTNESEIILTHDSDGFLVGKKRIETIESKLGATYDTVNTILSHLKGRRNGRRITVSGRLRLDSAQSNANNPTKHQRSIKPQSNSNRARLAKAGNSPMLGSGKAVHPLANQGERQKQGQITRQQRRYQDADAKSNQQQENLLKEINKNLKQGKSGGLLSKLMPLLGAAGLVKGLFKSPLALGKGLMGMLGGKSSKGMGGLLGRGTGGAAGAAGGGMKKLPKLMRGLGRGGILAALFAAFDGIGVENSDMDRPDKNKSHFKNFFTAGGGVAGFAGGAAAGAAIGSVVPVIGTAIGGIIGGVLGGIGGSTLAEYFIERVDNAIDKDLTRKMFGSWKGFISVMTYGANSIWQQLMPESVHTFFNKIGVDSSTLFTTISGLADSFWVTTGAAASLLWSNLVPKQAQDFFNKLWTVAKTSFDDFKLGFAKLFDAIAQSEIGQTLGDHARAVKMMASDAYNYVTGNDNSQTNADVGVHDSAQQQRNDAARRGGQNKNMSSMEAGIAVAQQGQEAIRSTVQQAYQASRQTTAAADYALTKALPASAGRCALYVNNSLRAQGLKVSGHGREVAGNLLKSNQGFHEVKLDENYKPQKGDVMSMDAPDPKAHIKKYGVHAGHVAIFDGEQWISDYKQGNKYGNTGAAGQSYYNMLLKDPSKATIARKGTYSGNSTQQNKASITQKSSQQAYSSKAFTPEKAASIARVAKNIGVNPNDLAAVISFETAGSFNPGIQNPGSSATGLIQFMDDKNAKRNKQQRYHYFGMNRSQFGSLPFDEQMNYVEKYFKDRGFNANKKQDIASTYTAVAGYGYRKGSAAYASNPLWDTNGDDYISKGEAVQNEKFKVHQRKYYATGESKVQTQKVASPAIVQSKAQQIAVNANNVALKTANIQAANIKPTTQSDGGQHNATNGLNFGANIGAQIAHAPVKRQVSHPDIANVASGGMVA